jgi:hypothetical protein
MAVILSTLVTASAKEGNVYARFWPIFIQFYSSDQGFLQVLLLSIQALDNLNSRINIIHCLTHGSHSHNLKFPPIIITTRKEETAMCLRIPLYGDTTDEKNGHLLFITDRDANVNISLEGILKKYSVLGLILRQEYKQGNYDLKPVNARQETSQALLRTHTQTRRHDVPTRLCICSDFIPTFWVPCSYVPNRTGSKSFPFKLYRN